MFNIKYFIHLYLQSTFWHNKEINFGIIYGNIQHNVLLFALSKM